MRAMPSSRRDACATRRGPVLGLVLAAAVASLALSSAALGEAAPAPSSAGVTQSAAGDAGGVDGQSGSTTTPKPIASATLTQCATATVPQTERSATFAGEMTAVAGTARMQIRVDLQERVPGESQYRTVTDPALGVWHGSTPGVKAFTHIQQVTNLSAPAFYRAVVRFRWVNAKGRTIKAEELSTLRCEQPAPPSSAGTGTSATAAGAGAGATGASS
ncbi:MAG: hypothetical protein JWN10_2613 [Solirubrobacterales bacterium]|nr:hypothetical protein [Solirubrobacterales bacterium]